MSHSVSGHLRIAVSDYDTSIRRFIPAYDEMLAQAARTVAEVAPRSVLDLGAGTGGLSLRVLEAAPEAHVELRDIDPKMLGMARLRLQEAWGRVTFTEGAFENPFPPCCAITASLALHHIPTLAAKKELYGRARSALRPGGVLVVADVAIPARDPARGDAYALWVHHMGTAGISEPRARAHLDEWAEEDTYFSVDDELAALEEAGLRARLVWQQGPSTVWAGSC